MQIYKHEPGFFTSAVEGTPNCPRITISADHASVSFFCRWNFPLHRPPFWCKWQACGAAVPSDNQVSCQNFQNFTSLTSASNHRSKNGQNLTVPTLIRQWASFELSAPPPDSDLNSSINTAAILAASSPLRQPQSHIRFAKAFA